MKEFMELLRKYPENTEGDVFEMLDTLGDFEAFKQLMFDHRAEVEGRHDQLKSILSITK